MRPVQRLTQRLRRHRSRRIRNGPGAGLRIGGESASANYVDGTNEPPVQRAVDSNLDPGDVFVDVGANVGFFSLLAARRVGPEGAVFAIEPLPRNVEAIQRNARRNRFGNIAVVRAAASDEQGSAILIVTDHPGGAALEGADTPPDATGTLSVTTTTLDDLVDAGTMRPPSLVKIDVEGAEVAVLRGMARMMRTTRPAVIVEVDGPDVDALERRTQAVQQFFDEADYRVERLASSYEGMGWEVAHLLAHPRDATGEQLG
jgi:FkbM family methyltransferase